MPNRYEYLACLIAKYLRQELNPEEETALHNWLSERPENQSFLDEFDGDPQYLKQKLQTFHEIDRERLWNLTQAKLAEEGFARLQSRQHKIREWIPYAAAAFVTIALISWYVFQKQSDTAPIIYTQTEEILPGGNRATLVLADGRSILLDETREGIIVGGDEIVYADGNVLTEVNNGNDKQEDIPWLELTTPRGGTYQITLPDGSSVWLNATTTLRYPARFTGIERKVELIGEAFFSVTKDENMPFKVGFERQNVEVLGTEFNISAYPDDPSSQTTLVNGRISISVHSAPAAIIMPGQQFTHSEEGTDIRTVDVRQYTAWKDGFFHFKQTPFDDMIRQIARWYNVEVSYQGAVPQETFSGRMQRELTLATMLELLNISDSEIQLDGRRLIIQ